MAGEIQKLIAYAPVKLEDSSIVQDQGPMPTWSVAVVAPASEVEGVVHSLYLRQFFLQNNHWGGGPYGHYRDVEFPF